MRVPLASYEHLVVRLHLLHDLASLPVPEPQAPLRITGHQEPARRKKKRTQALSLPAKGHDKALPAVWRKVGLARVASHRVPLEDLLIILAELVKRAVNQDLVVQGLTRDPFFCARNHKVSKAGP